MPVATAKMFGSKMMSSGGKSSSVDEQLVGAGADRDLAFDGVGLAPLVERHHDHGRAVVAAHPRLGEELLLALLERDRVDDRLALHALEPGLDDVELGRVDHHRHAAMSGSAAIRLRNVTIA